MQTNGSGKGGAKPFGACYAGNGCERENSGKMEQEWTKKTVRGVQASNVGGGRREGICGELTAMHQSNWGNKFGKTKKEIRPGDRGGEEGNERKKRPGRMEHVSYLRNKSGPDTQGGWKK